MRQRIALPWGTAAFAALAALAIGLAAGSARAGGPASFDVNSFNDKVDVSPGDGDCEAANGKCTLRAAVMESNAVLGAQTIRLRRGTYELSLEGAAGDAGDLDVTAETTIAGEGASRTSIEQTVADRVLDVTAVGAVTTVRDLTVDGGEAGRGGGIFAHTAVVVRRATVTRNRSTGAGASAGGGGISSTADLTISRSRIVRNTANASTMGASPAGGGIEQRPDPGEELFIGRSLISKNKAKALGAANEGSAGGLVNAGPGTIEQSTISGNATRRGGGLFHTGPDELEISESTISGNEGRTGAAWISFGPLTVTNATVSGNRTTDDGNGPAILRQDNDTLIAYSTIAGNRNLGTGASAVGGGPADGDGVTLRGTVLDNPGSDCQDVAQILTFGYNVASDASCDVTFTGDQQDAAPRLEAMAANGGPTRTHRLRSGSDAINVGDPGCPPPASDQTGHNRPEGASCDAGSYEKR